MDDDSEIILWFGKYNGQKVSEVPNDYLVWLTEKTSSPAMPEEFTKEQRQKVRERWKDLLSEVEDELNERQENNEREDYFT